MNNLNKLGLVGLIFIGAGIGSIFYDNFIKCETYWNGRGFVITPKENYRGDSRYKNLGIFSLALGSSMIGLSYYNKKED